MLGKQFADYKMYVLIFSTILSETFLILRIQHGITIHVHMFESKAPIIFFRFL